MPRLRVTVVELPQVVELASGDVLAPLTVLDDLRLGIQASGLCEARYWHPIHLDQEIECPVWIARAELGMESSSSFGVFPLLFDGVPSPLMDAEDHELCGLHGSDTDVTNQPAVVEVVRSHGRAVAPDVERLLGSLPHKGSALPQRVKKVLNRAPPPRFLSRGQ